MGTYNYIHGLDHERAEYMAEVYAAIYRRDAGEDIVIPPCPDPHPDNLFLPRWQETKRIHYARTHTVRDDLGYRWKLFCNVHKLPFIHIHEKRRGYATLEVKFPTGITLSPMMPRIRLIAQEANLVDIHDLQHLRNKRWYATDGITGLTITHPVPVEDVAYFVQSIVDILVQDGHFADLREKN